MPAIATETLALVAGLYMLAAGIGLLADPARYGGMMEEFRASGALTYLAAMLALILGEGVKPASTLLVISALASPEFLVEIEATAAK